MTRRVSTWGRTWAKINSYHVKEGARKWSDQSQRVIGLLISVIQKWGRFWLIEAARWRSKVHTLHATWWRQSEERTKGKKLTIPVIRDKLIWGFTLMPSGQIPRNFTFFFENMSRQRLNLLARHSRRLVSYGWEKAPDNTSLHGRRVLLSQFVLSFTWLLLRVPKRYILVQTALYNTCSLVE